MKVTLIVSSIAIFLTLFLYTIIGTPTRVDEIKAIAPESIKQRGWKILRYEGYQYGSWAKHGGKVWYHVADTTNPNVQYRVHLTLWDGELQYYYAAPEVLQRIEIN